MTDHPPRPFVLVPGMNHGGWCFEDLTARLQAAGHPVLALTLPGLAPGESVRGINLETHLDAVCAALEGLSEVVLVGHSYGGLLVSGAADRRPERIDSVVYLDAFVARDGERAWDLTNDEEREWYVDVDDSGLAVPPLPFFDERARPHPIGTLLQRIRLGGDLSGFRKRVYLYATRWPGESRMRTSWERVKDDPTWQCHALDSAHNFMRDVPEELAEILLGVAADDPSA